MKTNSILHTFIKYVSTNIMGMIGLSCYILADTFFIARGVGPDGLTALNLAIPVYSFINGLGLMIGMGGATRYSISEGNGEKKTRKIIFTQALFFVLILAASFFLTGLLLPYQLAALLGADAAILPLSGVYLRILLLFAPMFMLNDLLLCFVRNDGKPQLSMTAMLLGSLSNVILDYVFIFPLGLGMAGAAVATGIAPIVSILILSRHFIRKENQFRLHRTRISFKRMVDISSLGVSSLIVEVSSGVVIIVFNILILKDSGNLGVAAYGILANIALVLISIFTGISQGIQPVLSSCFGKREIHDIKKVLRYALTASVLFALISYGVTYIFSDGIVELFNKEHNNELREIAVNGMRIYFTGFLFIGINIISAVYFSSIDKPRQAFLISCLRGFLLVIPLAFLLSSLWGLTGIWLTVPATEGLVMLLSVIMLFRFRNFMKGR